MHSQTHWQHVMSSALVLRTAQMGYFLQAWGYSPGLSEACPDQGPIFSAATHVRQVRVAVVGADPQQHERGCLILPFLPLMQPHVIPIPDFTFKVRHLLQLQIDWAIRFLQLGQLCLAGLAGDINTRLGGPRVDHATGASKIPVGESDTAPLVQWQHAHRCGSHCTTALACHQCKRLSARRQSLHCS